MNFKQWLEVDAREIASHVRQWTDEGPIGQIATRLGKVIDKKLPGEAGGAKPFYGKGLPAFIPIRVFETEAGMVSEDVFPLQLPPEYHGQKQFRIAQYRIEKNLMRNRPPDMDNYIELRSAEDYVTKGFKAMVGNKLSKMGYHDQVELNPSVQKSIVDKEIRIKVLFRWKKGIR